MNINDKNHEWLRLKYDFIVSIPLTLKFYILSSNFHFLSGASFEFLLSEPYADLFEKPLSDLTSEDYTAKNLNDKSISKMENLKNYNKFRALFECGFGYDFDLGIELSLSLNFPITKFSLSDAILDIGAFYSLGIDIITIIENIKARRSRL